MKAAESNLEIKLTQLHMNKKRTSLVIESDNSETIKQHLRTLKTISDAVNHLRLEVEVRKLEKKVEATEIQTWNNNMDAKLHAADIKIGKIRKWLCNREKEADQCEKRTTSIRRRGSKDEVAAKNRTTS